MWRRVRHMRRMPRGAFCVHHAIEFLSTRHSTVTMPQNSTHCLATISVQVACPKRRSTFGSRRGHRVRFPANSNQPLVHDRSSYACAGRCRCERHCIGRLSGCVCRCGLCCPGSFCRFGLYRRVGFCRCRLCQGDDFRRCGSRRVGLLPEAHPRAAVPNDPDDGANTASFVPGAPERPGILCGQGAITEAKLAIAFQPLYVEVGEAEAGPISVTVLLTLPEREEWPVPSVISLPC